ncbi:MAG: TRAP dicarboxylate transporter subunit DctM [candidate division NC10 bacterium CSP1-5]|nr:MAG: TRAP dicarboxylate transporter subunit DctM [candidate division NC10 bacterium CSP1-5]
MEWLILAFVLGLTAIGVPIGYALVLSTAIFLVGKGVAPLTVIPLNLFAGSSSFPLLAIPLFILAGGLMETGGISLRLVNLASSVVGHIRGGLSMVTILATMIQSEISGSSVADAAAIGKVVIPAMEKRGYPRAFSAAVVSNAASAAILIPPSIPMIIYAWMAEESVARLFIAGFVPGFLAGGCMMLLSYYYARKYNFPVEDAFSLRRVGAATLESTWALLIPVVIWGGFLLGIATATEVAALAAVAALVIGAFIYREVSWHFLVRVLRDSSLQTAAVMVIVAASAVLGWYLTTEQVPQKFARAILETTNNKYLILLFLNLFFFLAGMFLHSAAAIILIVPIVMPLIRKLGIDPIHFGIIVTINLGVGQQTPPVASVLLTTAAIADIPFWEVFKAGYVYTLVLVFVTLLVTYVPWLSLFILDIVKL